VGGGGLRPGPEKNAWLGGRGEMRVVCEVKIRGDLGRGSVGGADASAGLGSMVIVEFSVCRRG
jgi:hypothetical protein